MISVAIENEEVNIKMSINEAKKTAALIGATTLEDVERLIAEDPENLYANQYSLEDIDSTAYDLFEALANELGAGQQ
jgi:hypothetical protein